MASKSLRRVLFQPGELVLSPTNLAAAFPFGGTRLGYTVDGLRVKPSHQWRGVSGEPGADNYEYLYIGSVLEVRCSLRQWDDDTLAAAFPGGLTASGADTGDKVWQYPGTLEPGSKLSDHAVSVLWAPTDTTRNEIVLLRKAVGILEEDLSFTAQESTTLRVVFLALPDTSIASGDSKYNSRVAYMGALSDTSV